MTKILAVITGVLALLLLGTTAEAKPASVPPPYQPDYEVMTSAIAITGPRPAGQSEGEINCPAGKFAISAGFNTDVTKSEPLPDGSGWAFTINHPTIDPGSIYQSVNSIVCANAAPPTG